MIKYCANCECVIDEVEVDGIRKAVKALLDKHTAAIRDRLTAVEARLELPRATRAEYAIEPGLGVCWKYIHPSVSAVFIEYELDGPNHRFRACKVKHCRP